MRKLLALAAKFPVLSLASGGALAQAVQILSYPLIARLFTPEDFGVFWAGLAVVAFSVALFTFQLDAAVLAARTSHVTLLLNVAAALLAYVAMSLLLLSLLVVSVFPAQAKSNLTVMALYVPVAIYLHGLYTVSVARVVRTQSFSRLGLAHLSLACATLLAQALSGFSGAGLAGLVVSDFVARIAGLAVLFNGRWPLSIPAGASIRRVFWRYRQFPKMMGPATILNVVSQNFQGILFPLVYGAAQAGQFGMANKLLAAPAGLTSVAIGQVFNGRMAALQGSDRQQRVLTLDSLYYATIIALPFTLAAMIGSELLLDIFLGRKWADAGLYASILAAGVGLSMMVSPLSGIFVIKKSLSNALYFSAFEFFVRGLPFVLFYFYEQIRPVDAVAMISAANVLLYVVGLRRMLSLVEVGFAEYARMTYGFYLLCAAAFLPALFARILEWGAFPSLLLIMAAAFVCFGSGYVLRRR